MPFTAKDTIATGVERESQGRLAGGKCRKFRQKPINRSCKLWGWNILNDLWFAQGQFALQAGGEGTFLTDEKVRPGSKDALGPALARMKPLS